MRKLRLDHEECIKRQLTLPGIIKKRGGGREKMKKAKGKRLNVKLKASTETAERFLLMERANLILVEIRTSQDCIDTLSAEYNKEVEQIKAKYEERLEPSRICLAADEKALIALMKKERGTFFDGTDVLQLENGALIHEVGDHVKIPRDALAKCEELNFNDVIKIAKFLDREAIEKWKDEKLFLIGAERKPVESFSYDLKKETI